MYTREEEIKDRILLLHMMEEYMRNKVEDEYLLESWLTSGIPDGATEEVYEWLAEEDEEYYDTVKVFRKIFDKNEKLIKNN